MDTEWFERLVREMRAKQKEYFRTRGATALAECRDLERRVDAMLDDRREDARQMRLFPEGGR